MAAFTVAKLLLSAVILCWLLQQAQVSALPKVGFTSVSSSETEASGSVTISLERTVKTDISTTVTIELTGTADKNSDYVVSGSLVVTFPPNDTTNKDINLSIIDDQVIEDLETIILTIRRDAAAFDTKTGFSTHTVSIADDDAPAVGFTSVSSSETETSGLATISLERTVRTDILTTVTIELTGTADKNSDYVVSGSLVVTFPPNDKTNKDINLFIIDDQVVEDLETIILKIRPDAAAFDTKTGFSTHTVSIADDDVNINCQNTRVTESAGTATVNITRSGSSQALTATHSIGCFTKDDTAVAPDDYTTINSVIDFTISNQTQNMKISIKNDVQPEEDETIKVRCNTNDVRVQINGSCQDAVVTIENDDIHTFFCPDGYPIKVREDIGNYLVDICRKGVLSSSPSIQFCRTSEGGISPSVSKACSDVAFAANKDRATASFPIRDDIVGEKELKTFEIYLNISDKALTSTDKDHYNVTIQDNDNTFSLRNNTKLQMTEGDALVDVKVTIDRDGEISAASNVSLQLVFAATAESADCTGSSPRVIQFNGGEKSKTITACTVADDGLVEDDETFNVTISGVGPSNVRIGKSERLIKLISNDVNVTCQGASVKEANGSAIVRLDRTGATEVIANDVLCSTADGTALSHTDYQSKTSATVSFAVKAVTQNFVVVVKEDNIPEGNETFTVTCTTSDPSSVVDSSCNGIQMNIINDDTYVFFCPGYLTSIEENVWSYTVRLCRVGVLEVSHTVKVCRSSDAISLPHDYPSVQAGCVDVVFSANDEVKELVIPVNNDMWGEQEYKTFNISMNTTDPRITFNDTTSYVVTIHDDDNTFYLTDITELQKTEGVGSRNITITINRDGECSVASNVSLQLVFNATAESADCAGSSPRVIQFNTGETSRTITVCTVVDDILIEDDETFNVTISGVGTNNIRTGKSERVIKLISDDVNITCHGVSVKEDSGPANVRLHRTGATGTTAYDIRCSTANSTAVSPADYQFQSSATVSFPLNDMAVNFPVVLTNDRVVEGNESFTVTCNTSDPRVTIDPSCSGIQINIINDDTYVFFCLGYSTSIEENVGSYTVRLCRVGVLEDTHTVRLCRSSDAVSLQHDYPSVQAGCDDIVFTAYDEVKELVIHVTNDTWGEQEYKTFNISMNTTDTGVTFNATTSYVVTIHDDDNTFCFTRTSTKVYEEHDKFVNLTIRRTGDILTSNASVTINTSPQTAITPEDYTEPILNQSLTFYTGEIDKDISVNIVNDKLVEDDQTFQFLLAGVNGSTVFLDCNTSTVTIVSNDVNIYCRNRRGPQSIYENRGPVLMEFSREGSLQYNHTMSIRTINGTGLSGADYTVIDKTVTFASNQTNINLTVVLVNDDVAEPDETFHLSVTSSDDRVNMICPGTNFTILNDDTFIRCAKQSIEVSEGNKTVYFTLKREGVVNTSSPIWFSTKDGTAFDKSDYKPKIKVNRTFLPGQVYMTLGVGLVDDEYNEDDENFSVIIGSYIPRTLTSGDKCVVITIKDDETTDLNGMTKQQAQEILVKERNLEILLAVGVGIMGLVVLFSIFFFCYLLRLGKKG